MSSETRHTVSWIDQGVAIHCPEAGPRHPAAGPFFFWPEETDGETVKVCPACSTGVVVKLELEVREGGGLPARDQAPQ